jgi:hypothetical protein
LVGTYSIPSETGLLATFNGFASKVRADLDSIFRDYEIADKPTLSTLLNIKVNLQELAGEHQAALGTIDEFRAVQEKPSQKLLTGIRRAFPEAAIEAKSTSGPAFEASYKKHLADVINPLPWDVVQDDLKQLYASSQLLTNSSALAVVKTNLDPSVQKSGALDNLEAWQLISSRLAIRIFIPLGTVGGEVFKQYIAAHKVVKPDIWAARENGAPSAEGRATSSSAHQ